MKKIAIENKKLGESALQLFLINIRMTKEDNKNENRHYNDHT